MLLTLMKTSVSSVLKVLYCKKFKVSVTGKAWVLKFGKILVFARYVKGATSQFEHLEKFGLHFSSSSFAIRVNRLHPYPSLFLFWFILASLVFIYTIKVLF